MLIFVCHCLHMKEPKTIQTYFERENRLAGLLGLRCSRSVPPSSTLRMMLSSNWQLILAQDARWNSFRQPCIRNVYLRRRSQLLADIIGDACSKGFDKDYMRLRGLLLTSMYGSPPDFRRTSRSDNSAAFQ
ncbi:WD repeat-containing protein 13-like, partial [Tropilaelaps mercedesae]